MTSKEELAFMNDVLGSGDQIDPAISGALTLEQTSWLNGWAERGFWAYGLNISGGWLTDSGKEHFIEMLWADQLPCGASQR